MKGLRRHLGYANVAATLALIFAMSSGALAARHYVINSTRQINPRVLRKLSGREGQIGPQGLQGESGKDGMNGATNVVVRFAQKENHSRGRRVRGGGMRPRRTSDWRRRVLGFRIDYGPLVFRPGGRPIFEPEEEGQPAKVNGRTPIGWKSGWANESGSDDTIRVYVICASP
jgi:hypothetical protein